MTTSRRSQQSCVPLDHYPSILQMPSSRQNSFTSLYIHTSMHHIHICLPLVDTSILFHPNELLRTKALEIRVSIQSFCFIPSHTVDTEQSTLPLNLWYDGSLTLLFFFSPQKDITDPGSSAYPLIHFATTVVFSLSFITLLCISDETRKLRIHLSSSDPAIMDLIAQFFFFRLYSSAFLLLSAKSLKLLTLLQDMAVSINLPFPYH